MATLMFHSPCGTARSLVKVVLPGCCTSSVARQSGCQSPGHPASLWRSPTSVAVRSAAWAVGASATGTSATAPRTSPVMAAVRRRDTTAAPSTRQAPALDPPPGDTVGRREASRALPVCKFSAKRSARTRPGRGRLCAADPVHDELGADAQGDVEVATAGLVHDGLDEVARGQSLDRRQDVRDRPPRVGLDLLR